MGELLESGGYALILLKVTGTPIDPQKSMLVHSQVYTMGVRDITLALVRVICKIVIPTSTQLKITYRDLQSIEYLHIENNWENIAIK